MLISYSGHVAFTMCFSHVVSLQYSSLNEASSVYIGIKLGVILPKHHKVGDENVTSYLQLILDYNGGKFDW